MGHQPPEPLPSSETTERRLSRLAFVAGLSLLVMSLVFVVWRVLDEPAKDGPVFSVTSPPPVQLSIKESKLEPGKPFSLLVHNPGPMGKRLCTDTTILLEQDQGGTWRPIYRLWLPFDGAKRGSFSLYTKDLSQFDIALCNNGRVPMKLPPLEPGTYRLTENFSGPFGRRTKHHTAFVTFELS